MKITALKPFVVESSGGLYVKVETDEGLYGLGFPGLSCQNPAVAETI